MLHPELTALFADLEREDIAWCVLRLPADLDHSGDADLLVERSHVERLRPVLAQREFVQLSGWFPGLHFLRYHQPTDRWIWLHVVTELTFGPYSILRTGAETGCLTRRERNRAVVTLADDDAFWVLLLHCLLDKGAIAPRHARRLGELVEKAQADGPLGHIVAVASPADVSVEQILGDVRAGRWDHLVEFAPRLAAAWRRHDGIGIGQILARRATVRFSQIRGLTRRRGLSVALLGPDGAGKSTLARGIQDSFLLPVRQVYMGLTGGLLPRVDWLRLPPLVVLGRLTIFWSRYVAARYHQARGCLVIFDRYVYDAYVPTPFPLNWLQRVYRWIDGHSCPAPDLVLVLNAPGEVMHRRKGEYTAEVLEDWRRHFLALEKRLDRLEVVDTTRSPELVRSDVVDRIWRRYAARWGQA